MILYKAIKYILIDSCIDIFFKGLARGLCKGPDLIVIEQLINSVHDPRAKALLQGVLNGGGNVQEAYNQMMGITGDALTTGVHGAQWSSPPHSNPSSRLKQAFGIEQD